MADQRVHPRFFVKAGAIAAIKPHSEILGQIIDISMGGLSFQYIDKYSDAKADDILLILFTEENFLLDEVPFSTVADFQINEAHQFSSLPMRRRCVRFGRLTPDQIESLSSFIISHTVSAPTASKRINSQVLHPLPP